MSGSQKTSTRAGDMDGRGMTVMGLISAMPKSPMVQVVLPLVHQERLRDHDLNAETPSG